MKKQKLKDLKKLLQIIKEEQNLNKELIEYDLKEIDEKGLERMTALNNMDFYATISFTADTYTPAKRDSLLNLIIRATENGVQFPQNSNEGINITAENTWKAKELKEEIEFIQNDIEKLEEENKDLQNFKAATKKQIKKLKKKKVNKK